MLTFRALALRRSEGLTPDLLRWRANARNVSTSFLPYGGITYFINSFDYPNLLWYGNVQGLKCLVYKPTRIETRGTKTSRTLIDVILSNQPELFKCSGIHHPALSDHALIYGILRNKAKIYRSKTISFRSYKNFDAEAFKEQLPVAPWHVSEIFSEVYYLQLLMKGIVDEHTPMKRMRVRGRDVPYMMTEWKKCHACETQIDSKILKE